MLLQVGSLKTFQLQNWGFRNCFQASVSLRKFLSIKSPTSLSVNNILEGIPKSCLSLSHTHILWQIWKLFLLTSHYLISGLVSTCPDLSFKALHSFSPPSWGMKMKDRIDGLAGKAWAISSFSLCVCRTFNARYSFLCVFFNHRSQHPTWCVHLPFLFCTLETFMGTSGVSWFCPGHILGYFLQRNVLSIQQFQECKA